MTFFALILAACAGAAFNFGFRKSLDGGGRANVFLMLQCFFAALVATALNINAQNFNTLDLATINLGVVEGCLYMLMMAVLGKAFLKGPPGLTVATMNSATIIPAIVMAILFGSGFGHDYTVWNGIGSLLVVLGLFIAARGSSSFTASKGTWALFALLAFAGHSLYLSLFQWRALLLQDLDHPFLSFALPRESAGWFQTLIFLTAGLILLGIYLVKDRRPLTQKEIVWGALGGACNSLCTFGLVWASEIAKEGEKAMIFPIAGVLSILLCSLWGKWIYKEQVSWKGSVLCLSGIVLGTLEIPTL
jgi:hypothetical protein